MPLLTLPEGFCIHKIDIRWTMPSFLCFTAILVRNYRTDFDEI
jgi:hypothetical protein